jgi:hypothetical protein
LELDTAWITHGFKEIVRSQQQLQSVVNEQVSLAYDNGKRQAALLHDMSRLTSVSLKLSDSVSHIASELSGIGKMCQKMVESADAQNLLAMSSQKQLRMDFQNYSTQTVEAIKWIGNSLSASLGEQSQMLLGAQRESLEQRLGEIQNKISNFHAASASEDSAALALLMRLEQSAIDVKSILTEIAATSVQASVNASKGEVLTQIVTNTGAVDELTKVMSHWPKVINDRIQALEIELHLGQRQLHQAIARIDGDALARMQSLATVKPQVPPHG